MSNPTNLRPRNRVDHLANERTFLAWIRTSLGLMAFGFVVEKFALFMSKIAYFFKSQGIAEEVAKANLHQGYTSFFGIGLVILGVLIGFFSFLKYKSIEKQIDEDTFQSSLTLGVVLTVAVVVIGSFLVIYLILS